MKKELIFKKLFVVVLAFIAIGCISCEKLKKDYRDKWVGDWCFEINNHWWSYGGKSGDSIYYYLGKICMGDMDNELKIDYTEYASIIMEVDKSGKLFLNSMDPHVGGNGQFEEADKIYLEHKGGGQGGGYSQKINGIKIKEEKK